MTSPRGRLVWMAIGLVAVIGLVYLLWDQIYRAFLHNPALNAGIYVVELIGIVYIFWQVIRLYPEIAWIERFKRGELGGSNDPVPRLLAPMEAMVRERTGRLTLSAVALRSLLDSISARLDETRDISRYFIGLMVFLGLLGTFWGLLGTIGGVADAIGAISVSGGGDIASLFGQLKSGLQGPLAGMGTAFSASLFGLSGSLLLGYLELQASQAQNRFFTELEDWLAERTRLTGAGPVGDGEQPIPVYIQALLEQTADNLENLQRILGRGEESRMQANAQMNTLFERLGGLTDQMRTEAQLMLKLAERQGEMRPVIAMLAEAMQSGRFGIDDQSRQHLRNIDNEISRLAEESGRNRQGTLQDLRVDLKKMTDSQVDLRPLLTRLIEETVRGRQAGLLELRTDIKKLADGQVDIRPLLSRLIEETARGRQSEVPDLRADIRKLAESQTDLRPMLTRLADLLKSGTLGFDDQSRQHLRSLDLQIGRLIDENSRGRQEMVQELRSEIKVLARTIAALAEEAERR